MEKKDLANVPIIIPAYEPDDRLIALLKGCEKEGLSNIIIVDDGSGPDYAGLFSEAREVIDRIGGTVLTHEINRGKGRALKTAFGYLLENQQDLTGVVTADSDGQHAVACIKKIINGIKENPQSLILGVRQFDLEDVPWKSRFGNNLTLKVVKWVSGLDVQDTQTGLRGIPRSFMKELLDVPGERFEFEMRMLLECVDKYDIVQIPIITIYDSRENHQTHFNPVKDSIKIYRILLERFVRYIISSLSSFVIDILLFTIFCWFFKKAGNRMYIALATVAARILSSIYNYLMNYIFVFNSKENGLYAALKYFLLAVIQMSCSALLVTLIVKGLSILHETGVKVIVDTFLFLISYQIQRAIVFRKNS